MTCTSGTRFRRPDRLGTLTATLGFLTVLSWSVARADSIDDALRCLEEQQALAAARDDLLIRADSLGARIANAGASVPKGWLRDAERIQRDAMDRELDLLVAKDRCRERANRALEDLAPRLDALERQAAAGQGGEAALATLLDLKRTRSVLVASIETPAVLDYPDLPPDSTDTQETLQAKLDYYRDVEQYLQRVDLRLGARLKELEAEQRVLEEAGRFVRDLAFLDEGGRVSSEGSVRLRGGLGGGEDPGEGLHRPSMELPNDSRSATLEFALRANPSSPQESERLRALLTGYSRELERELERIAERTQRIEARILPETSAP
ncbi:MAG: hypothetical protein IT349_10660 [Candidatus Eisenbacteria bacterium]|nr:hypothetical protein [Candidatus Eisenbacteria bacterium]